MDRAISVLTKVLATFTSVFLMLTAVIDGTPASTEDAEYLGSLHYVLFDALTMSQGLTTDPENEYFYTSGSIAAIGIHALAKADAKTGEIIARNNNPMPKELKDRGADHIGGISYYNGYIYAAIEDKPELYPTIALYDAETLEYTGRYYDLEFDYNPEGLPWVAVDADKGVFYTMRWEGADFLNVYDAESFEFIKQIPLSMTLSRVQGAEVHDGVVYMSADPHEKIKPVYAVDTLSGEVSVAFTRNTTTPFETEAEDITVTVDEGGNPIFHVSDYDRLIAVYVRSYKLK